MIETPPKLGARVMTAITSAFSKAVNAAPTSSMRMGLPFRLTNDRITVPVARPARRAASGRAMPGNGSRKATMVATAREAPADTPISSGPARGFLSVSCITAPETPSIPPATSPPMTLGSLRFCTINRWFPSEVGEPNRASSTSPTDRSGVPRMSDTTATIAQRQAMTATTMAARAHRLRNSEYLLQVEEGREPKRPSSTGLTPGSIPPRPQVPTPTGPPDDRRWRASQHSGSTGKPTGASAARDRRNRPSPLHTPCPLDGRWSGATLPG